MWCLGSWIPDTTLHMPLIFLGPREGIALCMNVFTLNYITVQLQCPVMIAQTPYSFSWGGQGKD